MNTNSWIRIGLYTIAIMALVAAVNTVTHGSLPLAGAIALACGIAMDLTASRKARRRQATQA